LSLRLRRDITGFRPRIRFWLRVRRDVGNTLLALAASGRHLSFKVLAVTKGDSLRRLRALKAGAGRRLGGRFLGFTEIFSLYLCVVSYTSLICTGISRVN